MRHRRADHDPEIARAGLGLRQESLDSLRLDAGLCATVNSDDPAYFGGYLNANFVQTVQALDLSREQVITLARNSFEASFIDDATRASYLARVEALAG